MDTSGNIRELLKNEQPADNEMELTREQANSLKRKSFKGRKNWMRNRLCTCGSGKKFKRCCWYKLARISKKRD